MRTIHTGLPLLLLLSAPLVFGGGCKKSGDENETASSDDDDDDGDDQPQAAPLFRVKGKYTPFSFRLPTDWVADKIHPDDVPAPFEQKEDEDPEVKLTGRLVFQAEAKSTLRKKGGVPPRIQIFHDPWLPVGTTATDYLRAQRETNEKAIKDAQEGASTKIRHVEAERSRREGRPAYYVRDEWDFSAAEQKVTVSQETLLLIEQLDDALHGYSIVITMLEEDKEVLGESVREMLDTVSFKE